MQRGNLLLEIAQTDETEPDPDHPCMLGDRMWCANTQACFSGYGSIHLVEHRSITTEILHYLSAATYLYHSGVFRHRVVVSEGR